MRIAIIKIILMCILISSTYAQVNITINIRRPTPALLSQWESDATLVTMIVVNNTSTEFDNAVFSIRIKDNRNNIMLSTNNLDPLQPRCTIKKMSTSFFSGKNEINMNAVSLDKTFKTKVTTTNMIPEGDYELCINLLDRNGNSISSRGEICTPFSIVIPDPPILIAPADGDSLKKISFPQFVWSPVTNVPPGMLLSYRLKIAPIYKGQTKKQALESNQLILDKVIQTSSYQYLLSDRPFSFFSDAVGVVWQVIAIDKSGKPATRNGGKSDVKYFFFK